MTDEFRVQDGQQVDKAKLIAAVVLVLAGVAGYYLLGGSATWLRWLPVALGIGLGALVVAWSRYGAELWQFVLDSRGELRKIVWPNRQETGMTTLVVFVFVIVA